MFVTGRLAADKKNEKLDYKLLAEFDGTIIFYMPVAQLETITKNLLKKNINPDTPAVIIQNATTPRQRAVYGCVKNIASKARQENIAPPAVLITGKTAVRKQKFAWFESLPLSGKNIIITRDRKGNSELAKKITTLGGNTVAADTFSFDDLTGKNEFLQTLTETKKCSWVVFTSRNGVKFTFERIRTLGKDARVFGNCKIAAIGEQTSQTLAQYGIKTDLLPSKFTSKQLGRELVNSQNITNKKILLIRSKLADERLVKILKSAKANVIQISAYDLKPLKLDTKQLLKMLENNQIHWITFASPFSAENFFSQIPIETVKKSKTKIASIGPVTSEKLHALGIKVNVQAQEHTINGLLEIMDSNQDLSP
jgi:uroporphyrinogen III methyltransferase/synthase